VLGLLADPIEEFQDADGNLASIGGSIAKARRAQFARGRRPRQFGCDPRHGFDDSAGEEVVALSRRNSKLVLLSNPAIEASQCPIPEKRTKWRAREKPVEAEAPAGVVEDEEPLHEDEKDVQPGPFGRVQI